ncbi:MAG: 3-dehydroquinate synthase [Candidatus Bathyarchaeota archaeon B63]|nr:MAG: 3-dehydroquinate synthase [Candidatus Bathyarchaeota archaeon B63]
MRELWIRVDPSLPPGKKRRLIGKAAKFTSTFVVDPVDVETARESGAERIVSKSERGDIILVDSPEALRAAKRKKRRVCVYVSVKNKGDENEIISAAEASADYVIAACPDWKVIPLENIIAAIHGKTRLLALASTVEEGRTALETLEIGADGIVTDIQDPEEIEKLHSIIMEVKTRPSEIKASEKISLLPAEVSEVRTLGSGARVCIDTCDLMREGEGMLVGCQSSGLFLVEAEVHETPFVAPRPFRVNAGSIALYVLAPGGKTRYLSELKAGDEVLIVDREGNNRTANICRVKIEWRPLILVEAKCEGRTVKTILQNAETIRVMTDKGSRSVSELKPGDKVLVHIEEGGRHFGELVKEERVIER